MAERISDIEIVDACEHNLRHLSARIPRGSFSVVTGVSGSGKSTLAFDILFASGQRRYLDCVSAYARQFVQPQARPDVRELRGLPPTVAIEQRLSQGGWKSTVATVTEIHNDLRLLFLTLGEQRCPDCGVAVEKQSPEQIADRIVRRERAARGGDVLRRRVRHAARARLARERRADHRAVQEALGGRDGDRPRKRPRTEVERGHGAPSPTLRRSG